MADVWTLEERDHPSGKPVLVLMRSGLDQSCPYDHVGDGRCGTWCPLFDVVYRLRAIGDLSKDEATVRLFCGSGQRTVTIKRAPERAGGGE